MRSSSASLKDGACILLSRVKEQGLTIDSCDGDFTLPTVNAYRDATAIPPCDGVVIALKATQNHVLPQLLPSVVNEKSVVVLLQNGLGAEDQIAEIVKAPIKLPLVIFSISIMVV